MLEGRGRFLLEGCQLEMKAGDLLVAPEGVPHGVHNTGPARLLLLAVLAPSPRWCAVYQPRCRRHSFTVPVLR